MTWQWLFILVYGSRSWSWCHNKTMLHFLWAGSCNWIRWWICNLPDIWGKTKLQKWTAFALCQWQQTSQHHHNQVQIFSKIIQTELNTLYTVAKLMTLPVCSFDVNIVIGFEFATEWISKIETKLNLLIKTILKLLLSKVIK